MGFDEFQIEICVWPYAFQPQFETAVCNMYTVCEDVTININAAKSIELGLGRLLER